MQNSLPFAILRRAYALTDIRHHHPSVRVIDRLRPLDAMQHRSNWHRALATVLAEERRGRTAEDERRDVLASLAQHVEIAATQQLWFAESGDPAAASRSDAMRFVLETASRTIARGDHEGASTR